MLHLLAVNCWQLPNWDKPSWITYNWHNYVLLLGDDACVFSMNVWAIALWRTRLKMFINAVWYPPMHMTEHSECVFTFIIHVHGHKYQIMMVEIWQFNGLTFGSFRAILLTSNTKINVKFVCSVTSECVWCVLKK